MIYILIALIMALAPVVSHARSCEQEVMQTSAREDFLAANLFGNMRFPQINSGIRIASLVQYFKRPVPLKQLLKKGSREELDRFAEQMNRVHQAYGIDYATRYFPTERPAQLVTRERIRRVLDGGSDTFVYTLVATLHFCFPNGPFKNDIRKFRLRKTLYVEEYYEMIDRLDRFLLTEPDPKRMRTIQRLIRVLEKFQNSDKYRAISNAYKNSLRYQAALERGENPEKPPEVFDKYEAVNRLYKALKPKVKRALPMITDQAFHRWAIYGIQITRD